MSFEPQKVIEFDKGKQIGQTLTQHADNIPYEDTTVGAELDSINTHLYGIPLGNFSTVAGASSPTISNLSIPQGATQLRFVFKDLTDAWSSPIIDVQVESLTDARLGKVLYSIYHGFSGNIVLSNGKIGADLININTSTRIGVIVEVYYR